MARPFVCSNCGMTTTKRAHFMWIAAIVGFFFDSKEGAARRHMAYAKAVAKRNRAMGMVSELRRKADDTPSEPMAGTGA